MRKCVSALVSWFISLPQEQSLYPGRPRGGLTYSSRLAISPDADPLWRLLRVLRRIHSLGAPLLASPRRAQPSFPRHTQLRMDMKTSLILARPLATALWPRPSSSALVRWVISLPQEQSLYPGRPRGGLTYSSRLVTFSNRCRPPVEALRVIPRIHSLWCAPATASPRRAQPLRV